MNKVKIEDIKALLPELSEEGVNKLQQLFDRNFSTIVTGFENDIYDITRISKKDGQKYHEYLKSAFGDYILANTNKTELDELKTKVKTLETEKMQLEDKIRVGTTGKTKEDIEKLEKLLTEKDGKITEMQNQMKLASEKFEAEKQQITKESKGHLKSLMIGSVKEKYKIANEAITDQLKDVIYRDVETKLEEFDIRLENKIPVLYKDNQLQYSAKNPLEVLSLDNFYKEQLEPYGTTVITGIPGQAVKTGTGVISGAKNKNEAALLIDKHLASKGIDQDSENYNTEFTKIAKETGAFELPAE